MKDALKALPIPPVVRAGLLLSLALAVAPHLWHLDPWITGFFYAMAGLYALALRQPKALPGRFLLFLLMLAGLVDVVMHGGGLDGRASGTSLLTVMLGLKLLETRTRRDVYVTLFLGYFMVATQFLFAQGLGLSLYLALVVLGLTAVLNALHRVDPQPLWGQPLRDSALLLLASLPLMVILFVLFPRLGGPLWQLAAPPNSAVTGLSDRLRLGGISQLSQSRALAFRVRFDQTPPPPAQRYWRGPVLWQTDGREWLPAEGLPNTPPRYQPLGEAVGYEVTLEPNHRHWLFALDLPAEVPPDAAIGRDFQIQANQPVDKRRQYHLRSYPAYRVLEITPRERRLALQYPADTVTPRMRALLAQWQRQDPAPAGVVDQALTFFRQQPFVYTLSPPPLGANPVDSFLFDTQRGFCEHYASSFALLMRIAGIPSRVVTGYQGGEWNPQGEYFALRQSDAHAWAEVWINELGWVRVDPTAAVAPERIERPIDPTTLGEGAPVSFAVGDLGLLRGLWRNGRWLVDNLEYSWQHWVVNFSQDSQHQLLRGLGLGFLQGYWLGIASVVGGMLSLLPIWWLLRQKGLRSADALARVNQRWRDKLRKAGMVVPDSLGPHDLGEAAARHFPEQADRLRLISRLYVALRYGEHPNAGQLSRLRQMVGQLRLRRAGNGPSAGSADQAISTRAR